MSAAVLALTGVGGGLVAWTSWRERRHAIAKRGAMLDDCAALFDDVALTIAPDGFPKLSGTLGSRRLRIALVADTLVPKRLPQLWLVMSQPGLRAMPHLARSPRPRGADFISAAGDLRHQYEVPAWLPTDCAVRGDERASASGLDTLRAPLETAFADPRLKEIALGPAGLRLVYQVDQGRRGAHLLLRQTRFEKPIDPASVQRCAATLRDIEDAAGRDIRREAA